MEFNWYENCEKILKTHTLTNRNLAQAHGLVDREQEIVFLNFLIGVGKTREECFVEWKKITNGIAKIFENDIIESAYEFDLLYKNATLRPSLTPDSKPIVIFTAEIDALNSFQVPLWIKKYWLLVLAWIKYQKANGQRHNFNYSVRRWALTIANPEYSYKRKSELLQKYNVESGKPLKNVIRGNRASLSVSFEHTEGEVIFEFYSLDRIKEAFYLLEAESRVCQTCGDEFIVNSKTKRDICEKCYNPPAPRIEICPVCGDEFIIHSKTKRKVCETCFRLKRSNRTCITCGKSFIANSKTKRDICESCFQRHLNARAYKRVRASRERHQLNLLNANDTGE